MGDTAVPPRERYLSLGGCQRTVVVAVAAMRVSKMAGGCNDVVRTEAADFIRAAADKLKTAESQRQWFSHSQPYLKRSDVRIVRQGGLETSAQFLG